MDERFLAGVIEGFYGQPWSHGERVELFEWMKNWGLNTYLYAPKDDLKQRAWWREPPELEDLGPLVGSCQSRGVRFIYALSPGLDIQYESDSDLDLLKERIGRMRDMGCENFALLFDDIPQRPESSLAQAQAKVANTLAGESPGRFLFCPTAYCGRMAKGKEEYLSTLGRELTSGVDVFWTGPEIISPAITVAHIKELQTLLGRKPIIWDNLHANDYDGRRFYCGPYAGRPPELRDEVGGLLVNPNNEFPLNYVPLRTFAEFVRGKGMWDARKAYLSAMAEWLPQFGTIGEPVTLEDLILFGDCYYLPHEEGPEAQALLRSWGSATVPVASVGVSPTESGGANITGPQKVFGETPALPFVRKARRLRDFCARLAELGDRSLFYALHRRAWELREELDLLIGYYGRLGGDASPYRSDSHLPGTFRGGMVARLQRLLTQREDGTFTP